MLQVEYTKAFESIHYIHNVNSQMLTTELPFNRQEALTFQSHCNGSVVNHRGKPPDCKKRTRLQRKHTLSLNPINSWIFSSDTQAAEQTAMILHLGNQAVHLKLFLCLLLFLSKMFLTQANVSKLRTHATRMSTATNILIGGLDFSLARLPP